MGGIEEAEIGEGGRERAREKIISNIKELELGTTREGGRQNTNEAVMIKGEGEKVRQRAKRWGDGSREEIMGEIYFLKGGAKCEGRREGTREGIIGEVKDGKARKWRRNGEEVAERTRKEIGGEIEEAEIGQGVAEMGR